MYDYDYDGLGLRIDTPIGSLFLQGEEAAELYDQLEAIADDDTLAMVLSEYEHIIEEQNNV